MARLSAGRATRNVWPTSGAADVVHESSGPDESDASDDDYVYEDGSDSSGSSGSGASRQGGAGRSEQGVQLVALREALCELAGGAEVLMLWGQRYGDAGARRLAAALTASRTLEELYLGLGDVGAAGARALARALAANRSLLLLALDDNSRIGAPGAVALAIALARNRKLRELDLRGCRVGAGGSRALAAGLRANRTLLRLDLSDNGVGAAGAAALAALLASRCALASLELRDNSIDAQGAAALAAALTRNGTLRVLDLADNDIGDAGAAALAAALASNRALTRLQLARTNAGAAGVQALVAALDGNSTLRALELGLCGDAWQAWTWRARDRLRVNALQRTLPAWLRSAVARRGELAPLLPGPAARVAVLAWGDALVPARGWRTPGGRAFAAQRLLPLAENALRAKLERRCAGPAGALPAAHPELVHRPN